MLRQDFGIQLRTSHGGGVVVHELHFSLLLRDATVFLGSPILHRDRKAALNQLRGCDALRRV